jgi:hypothetical protein
VKVTALYFLEQAQVASSSFECNTTPHSSAYFCPTCGKIWARIVCTSESFPRPQWDVQTVPCEKHKASCVADWSRVPGSLTDPFEKSANLSTLHWGSAIDKLPPVLLDREFSILLDYYEKEFSE